MSMNFNFRKTSNWAGALSLLMIASGCGSTNFVASSTSASQAAPGNFMVPPKVDILLVEDDTGSMQQDYSNISGQFPSFLSTLDSQGWDYHFVTMPLTTKRKIKQATASKYDGNYGSAWVAPYPGAQQNNSDNLSASVFETLANYTGFLTPADIASSANSQYSYEGAMENIRQTLLTETSGTGFIRPDAMLAVFVISTGDDTSNIRYCNRGDGYYVPCEQAPSSLDPICPTPATSIAGQPKTPGCGTVAAATNYYTSVISGIKGNNTSQVQFYAAVSGGESASSCGGVYSYAGTHYTQFASAMNGTTYDICTQSISSVLTSLASNLQSTAIAMRTHYLFINEAPTPSSIQVTRYAGGNTSDSSVIPQDPNNGWSYAGYVNNVYAIDYPVPMDMASGYAIQLNGSAQLSGGDTASVSFTPAGVQSTSTTN